MRVAALRSGIVVIAVAVLGCGGGKATGGNDGGGGGGNGGGGNGGGGNGGGGSGLGLTQFPARFAQAMCAQNFRCCPSAELGTRTMETCVEDNTAVIELLAQEVAASQSRGRVVYDGGKMQMCIDAVAAMSCAQWSVGFSVAKQPAVCDEAVAAQVAPGGACLVDIECTTHTCEGENLDLATDGTCSATSSLGKPCTADDACSSGHYCDLATSTCAAQKAAGETCNAQQECATWCDLTTYRCTCYAGCAVGGENPRLGIAWLLAGVVGGLFVRRGRVRDRRGRPRR